MEHIYCPFDEKDCTSECSLYIGSGDWENSPCALAQIGAHFRYVNDECNASRIQDSLLRVSYALESIAKHFDPKFIPYSEE